MHAGRYWDISPAWIRQFDGHGKTTTGPGSRLPGDPERPGTRYPVVILHAGSLACLVTRRLPDGDHEFGAHAYGPTRIHQGNEVKIITI